MTLTEKKFYKLFWDDNTCRSIFSTHKSQLLEGEVELILSKEKYYAQRMVLTNSLKRKKSNQLIQRNENKSIEIIHKSKEAITKYINEDKVGQFITEKFGQTIKKIESELKSPSSTISFIFKFASSFRKEEDVFKFLSDYSLIPKTIKNEEQFIDYLESQMKQQINLFLKNNDLYNLAISIDLLSSYYNLKIKNNLLNATKHYTDILYDNENYKSRIELFDSLYEKKILKGGKLKSYYECVNCEPNIFNGIISLDIRPSKLKLKCPNCNKETLYIVPYELEKNVYEKITSPDGLLFHAIEYLLAENKYLFTKNKTFLRDVEIDFCIKAEIGTIKEFIEVKMFKNDRPEDTQIFNLRSSVSQIKKSINKLIKTSEDFRKVKLSLVTNIENSKVLDKAKKELHSDLTEYGIIIYTIEEFRDKIEKFDA